MKNGKDKRLYPMKRNLGNQNYFWDKQGHKYIVQSQKGLTVGACHDVSELSYDNDIYI